MGRRCGFAGCVYVRLLLTDQLELQAKAQIFEGVELEMLVAAYGYGSSR